LSTTANTSLSQAFVKMEPGGRFEGFRYSTPEELGCGLLGSNNGLGCQFNWITFDVEPVFAFFAFSVL
jgi:hypothetical protein